MKPAVFWTINVFCLILGVALAVTTRSDDPSKGETTADRHSEAGGQARFSKRGRLDRTKTAEGKSATRSPDAWIELAGLTGLTALERHDARVKILKKWIESDPESALRAALEMMRRDAIFKGVDPSLMHVFTDAMTEDPEGFWEMVKDERFGLQSGIARMHWIETIGEVFPSILASHVRELTGNEVTKAVAAVLGSPNQTQAGMDAWIQEMAGLPNRSANRAIFNEIGKALSEESFQTLLSQASNENFPGAAQMAKSGIVARFSMSNDPEQIRHQLSLLPRSLRTEVTNSAADQIDKNPLAYTVIIDEVIQSGDWDIRAKEMGFKLHNMLSSAKDPVAIATWATTIPPEKRFEDIYRVGIRSYLQSKPSEAYEWILSLPAGWHRDNSLTGYVQSSLFAQGNEQKALEAQKLIRDDHFRRESQGMLEDWRSRR